jgi:hypothetical protein
MSIGGLKVCMYVMLCVCVVGVAKLLTNLYATHDFIDNSQMTQALGNKGKAPRRDKM